MAVLATVPLKIIAKRADGTPVANAHVRMALTVPDTDGQVVVPSYYEGDTDNGGELTLNPWPNTRGRNGSQYLVEIKGDGLTFRGLATVPEYACNLHDILQLQPGAVSDGQAAVLLARDWAIKTGGPVDAGELSAKAHAQAAKADREQADLDAQATAGDRVQTGLDRGATGADRIQTGLDKNASGASASQASNFMLTAIAQASLASIYALAAASVVQQDLSGAVGAALHRSPNAVVATAFMDTSKDSNPNWPAQVDASYLYETLNGAWIGSANGIGSEPLARALGGTLSASVAAVSLGTATDWTPGTSNAITTTSGGALRATSSSGALPARLSRTYVGALTVGKTYVLYGVLQSTTSGSGINIRAGSGTSIVDYVATNTTMYGGVFRATTTDLWVDVYTTNNGVGVQVDLAAIFVKEVTAFAPSGSYYPNATDGKFYRLWKNLLKSSGDFAQGWTANPGVSVSGAVGAQTVKASAGSGSQGISQSVTYVPGTVTFTAEVAATGARYGVLSIDNNGGLIAAAKFDLQTLSGLTAVHPNVGTGGTVTVTPSPTAGRYLVIFTVNGFQFNSTQAARIIPSTSDPTPAGFTFTAVNDGVGALPVFNAQVQSGATFDAFENKTPTDGSQTETFRGNKARPPRLGELVLEQARLVIYDILEPGRPMWAVLKSSSSINLNAWLGAGAVVCSGIAYKEGVIYVATASQGLRIIDLAKDRGSYRAGAELILQGNFTQRNTDFSSVAMTMPSGGIASAAVNAVSVTTMPDAPVDPVTWLQVPTVAVFTNGGISEIKHDGTVVSSAQTGAFSAGTINPYVLIGTRSAANGDSFYYTNPGKLGATFAHTGQLNNTAAPDWARGTGARLAQGVRGAFARIDSSGGTSRLALLRLNEMASTASLAAQIADTYNTGWMIGDIRRCLLSDILAGPITGTELVTNGDFGTGDLSGWTNSSGTGVVTGGQAVLTNPAGGGRAVYYQAITVEVGKTYRLTVGSISSTGTGAAQVRVGNTAPFSLDYGSADSVSRTLVFTPKQTTVYVSMGDGAALSPTDTTTFDNISVVAVVADRSYKNKPLTVFGTLTKAQVGTGSQLVAYSGFSAANYLRETAHSTDLDPGTGPLRVGGWSITAANPQFNQNLIPKSNLFGAGSGWSQDGVTVADGSLTTGGHTYALLQQPAASTGGNRIFQFGPTTALGVSVNNSWLVRRNGASTDQLLITAVGYNGVSLPVTYDPVTQAFIGASVGWTISVIDASTVRISNVSTKGVNFSSGYWQLQVKRVSDGAVFGGGTGGLYAAEYQMTIGAALLPYEDVPGAVTVRCHPIEEYSYSAGAYYTVGHGGDGFPMVEVWDSVNPKRTASLSSQATATLGANYFTGTPVQIVGEYDTGGTLTLRVNSKPLTQATGSPLATLTNANAVLTVGQNYALNAPFPGSLALPKVGMTIATDDASDFCYRQELAMFRDGAQVTLPDSGACVDLDYDPQTDCWRVASAANESEFHGLVRTASTPASAGSISKVAGRQGMKAVARTGTNPGVDITMPPQNLKEEQLKRAAEELSRIQTPLPPMDWQGAFTANTALNSAIVTVTGNSLVIPPGATAVGARVSGAGIPANTTILGVNGTQVQLSNACTATAAGVTVSMQDLILPIGQSPHVVCTAGAGVREGSGFAWTRGFDGFRERVSYVSVPGNQWLQVESRRAA